jgi:hypothetical protein
MSMKNSSDTIGNRTRNLPTCSAVPQPTAPPAACPNVIRSCEIKSFMMCGSLSQDTGRSLDSDWFGEMWAGMYRLLDRDWCAVIWAGVSMLLDGDWCAMIWAGVSMLQDRDWCAIM